MANLTMQQNICIQKTHRPRPVCFLEPIQRLSEEKPTPRTIYLNKLSLLLRQQLFEFFGLFEGRKLLHDPITIDRFVRSGEVSHSKSLVVSELIRREANATFEWAFGPAGVPATVVLLVFSAAVGGHSRPHPNDARRIALAHSPFGGQNWGKLYLHFFDPAIRGGLSLGPRLVFSEGEVLLNRFALTHNTRHHALGDFVFCSIHLLIDLP